MKGKKTSFECSTGNCHAEIAPPIIFLNVLSFCDHAVITQNPLSSSQMSSAHQLPPCPPLNGSLSSKAATQEATAGVVFSGSTWFPANASRKGPWKALLPVLQSPGNSPVHAPVLEHQSHFWSKDLSVSKWGSHSWAPPVSHNIIPYCCLHTETQIHLLITTQQSLS